NPGVCQARVSAVESVTEESGRARAIMPGSPAHPMGVTCQSTWGAGSTTTVSVTSTVQAGPLVPAAVTVRIPGVIGAVNCAIGPVATTESPSSHAKLSAPVPLTLIGVPVQTVSLTEITGTGMGCTTISAWLQ